MNLHVIPASEQKEGLVTLIRELFDELTELMQQHIELAKTELREETRRVFMAAALGIVGIVFSLGTLLFLGVLIIMGMVVNGLPLIAATGILTGVLFVLTLISFGVCLKQIKSAQNLLKNN